MATSVVYMQNEEGRNAEEVTQQERVINTCHNLTILPLQSITHSTFIGTGEKREDAARKTVWNLTLILLGTIKVRPLKVLVFPTDRLRSFFKCLTKLWKEFLQRG